MKTRTISSQITLALIIMLLVVQCGNASWTIIPIPNGSFEQGTLCTVPDYWVMKIWDRDGNEPVPGATYIHEVCENNTHYFSGQRSCWLHSRVVDTDGTKASRGSWTWIEPDSWINAPTATHVRFYIKDIQPTHSLYWGWNCGIYIGFNDSITEYHPCHFIYNNGETLNFNHYNDTKVGADGATWYEYIYPIPLDIDRSHMKFYVLCFAGDWTFYATSYFADMSFYIDNVELLYQPPQPLSVSISPLSESITIGESVPFISGVVGGTPPYNYQWYLNDNPVSGATSDNWTFTPTSSGTYYIYLKVTDDIGETAQSETAKIVVAGIPVGGYSFQIKAYTIETSIIYIAVAAVLAAFTSIGRKKRRRTKQS